MVDTMDQSGGTLPNPDHGIQCQFFSFGYSLPSKPLFCTILPVVVNVDFTAMIFDNTIHSMHKSEVIIWYKNKILI